MKKLLNLSLLFAFIIFIGCEKKEKQADTKKDTALTLMNESTERLKKH